MFYENVDVSGKILHAEYMRTPSEPGLPRNDEDIDPIFDTPPSEPPKEPLTKDPFSFDPPEDPFKDVESTEPLIPPTPPYSDDKDSSFFINDPSESWLSGGPDRHEKHHPAYSLLEAIERGIDGELETKGLVPKKVEQFFSPVMREKLNFGIAAASLLTLIPPLAGAGGLLRAGRAILGIWNYSTLSGKFGIEHKMRKEVPGILEETDELIKKVETGEITGDEQEHLHYLLSLQLTYYKQGILLEKYETKPPTPPEPSKLPKFLEGRLGKFEPLLARVASKELAKTVGKAALYSSPLLATFLAPAVAPILMAGTTGLSLYERSKRIKELSEAEKEKPAFRDTVVGKNLERYEAALDPQLAESGYRDSILESRVLDILTTTNQEKTSFQIEKMLYALPGTLLSSLYYMMTMGGGPESNAPSTNHTTTSEEVTPLPQDPENAQLASQQTGGTASTPPAPGASPPPTPQPTGPAHGALTPAGPAEEEGLRPAGSGHTTPTRPAGMPNEGSFTPAGPADQPESRASGPADPDKGRVIDYEGQKIPPHQLFEMPAKPEYAEQEFGQIFEQDGQRFIMLDLDADSSKDAGEVFKVIEEGGKHFALVNWADIRGQDGIPDYLSKHAVKLEIPSSGTLTSVRGNFGHLVSSENPNQYVSRISESGTVSYTSRKEDAFVMQFSRKADVVSELLGDAWSTLKQRLGQTVERRDWSNFVARSGAMASIDHDLCPEIQVHRIGEKLQGNWHSLKFTFTPTEAPFSEDEILSLAQGDEVLARHLAQTSFAYASESFRPTELTLDRSLEEMLSTLRTNAGLFSPESERALLSALDNSESFERIRQTLEDQGLGEVESLDVETVFEALGIPLDTRLIESIPDTAPTLSLDAAKSQITALLEEYKHDPWILSLRQIHHNLSFESNTSSIRLIPQNDRQDILALTWSDGREKHYVVPPQKLKP